MFCIHFCYYFIIIIIFFFFFFFFFIFFFLFSSLSLSLSLALFCRFFFLFVFFFFFLFFVVPLMPHGFHCRFWVRHSDVDALFYKLVIWIKKKRSWLQSGALFGETGSKMPNFVVFRRLQCFRIMQMSKVVSIFNISPILSTLGQKCACNGELLKMLQL